MKRVILIFGLQGSGKSTIANELGKILNSDVLTTEQIRAELFELENSQKDTDFTDFELKLTYKTIEIILSKIAPYTETVIIDGVFRYYKQRDRILDLCQKRRIKLIQFFITCSEEVAKQRLIKRKQKKVIQPGGYETYLKVKQNFEYPIKNEITIDTTEINLNKAIKKINYAIEQE